MSLYLKTWYAGVFEVLPKEEIYKAIEAVDATAIFYENASSLDCTNEQTYGITYAVGVDIRTGKSYFAENRPGTYPSDWECYIPIKIIRGLYEIGDYDNIEDAIKDEIHCDWLDSDWQDRDWEGVLDEVYERVYEED